MLGFAGRAINSLVPEPSPSFYCVVAETCRLVGEQPRAAAEEIGDLRCDGASVQEEALAVPGSRAEQLREQIARIDADLQQAGVEVADADR